MKLVHQKCFVLHQSCFQTKVILFSSSTLITILNIELNFACLNVKLLHVLLIIATGSFNSKVSVFSYLLPIFQYWISIVMLFLYVAPVTEIDFCST